MRRTHCDVIEVVHVVHGGNLETKRRHIPFCPSLTVLFTVGATTVLLTSLAVLPKPICGAFIRAVSVLLVTVDAVFTVAAIVTLQAKKTARTFCNRTGVHPNDYRALKDAVVHKGLKLSVEYSVNINLPS